MIPSVATLWLSLASLFGLDPCMGPVPPEAQTCPALSDAEEQDTPQQKDAQQDAAPAFPIYSISNGF